MIWVRLKSLRRRKELANKLKNTPRLVFLNKKEKRERTDKKRKRKNKIKMSNLKFPISNFQLGGKDKRR